MYLNQLETRVADEDLMTYEGYNRISNAYLKFRSLLKDGIDLFSKKIKFD